MKIKKVLLLLLFLPTLLPAQKAIMDIHLMLVSATEDAGYLSNTTFGGGIMYDFFLNENLSLGMEADYIGNRYAEGDSAVNIIPIQALVGGHWNVSENFDVYGGTGVGFFWQRYKNGFSLSSSEVIWGLTPRIGFNFEMAQDVFLTSCLKYSLSLGEPLYDDVNGRLMFSLGIGYNINAEL